MVFPETWDPPSRQFIEEPKILFRNPGKPAF
jgi:hypothetical protein